MEYMIVNYYRGHEGTQDALANFGIIWLTDEPEYAQQYADEYPDGVVSTVFVDLDKVRLLDVDGEENDLYDPDMGVLKELMDEQGGNAYKFYVNGGTEVLALLSTEPVVRVEREIIEKKKRNMRLTENDIKYIVAEATRRLVNEYSSGRKIKEDFTIDMNELVIEPYYLEDELDQYSGPAAVHMELYFTFNKGQEGSYDVEPISDSYELVNVVPAANMELDRSLSPELFGAVLKAATNFVWEHQGDFEQAMAEDNQDFGPDPDEEFEKRRERNMMNNGF